MKTFLKIVGFAVAGIVAIVIAMKLLGFIGWLLSWAIGLAVVAGIGFVVVKMMSGGTSTPAKLPELAEARTEESRTIATAEKKALSDADAAKMFEDARRKQTEKT